MSSSPAHTEPTFDLRWSETFEAHEADDLPWNVVRFALEYKAVADDDPHVCDAVADLYVDAEFPDDRADWHRNTHDITAWVKAHIARVAMGWGDQKLADWFAENPRKALDYGFYEHHDLDHYEPDPPGQSRLWELWNEEFSDDQVDDAEERRRRCLVRASGATSEMVSETESAFRLAVWD